MARNLPIQTVKPREDIDQFLKEGGGGVSLHIGLPMMPYDQMHLISTNH